MRKRATKLELERRRAIVAELVCQGYNEKYIAKELETSITIIKKDIKAIISEYVRNEGDIPIVRATVISRLEYYLQKLVINNPGWSKDMGVTDRIIRLVEKIANYSGVAPIINQKIEHSGLIETNNNQPNQPIELIIREPKHEQIEITEQPDEDRDQQLVH